MRIYKEFQVEAAHLLPNLPDEHKCRRLHGHSFRIGIHVEGPLDEQLGWVMDFADISRVVFDGSGDCLFDRIAHRFLNEIEGLENPTSENLAKWIWQQLQGALPTLAAVHVNETCTTGCIYEGDD